MDVNELRTKTPKVDKEQLIFVESNNPNNPQVFQKILDFINFLKTDPKYDSLLKNVEIIKSQKQTLNLEKLLKRSYFGTEKFNFGSHKCGSCSILTIKSLPLNDQLKILNKSNECWHLM